MSWPVRLALTAFAGGLTVWTCSTGEWQLAVINSFTFGMSVALDLSYWLRTR